MNINTFVMLADNTAQIFVPLTRPARVYHNVTPASARRIVALAESSASHLWVDARDIGGPIMFRFLRIK